MMPNRTYIKQTKINADIKTAFAWHERDGAIQRLTPPWAPLTLIKRDGNGVDEGVRVWFRIKMMGIPMIWQAFHFFYRENEEFRDRQEKGPFAFWEHRHRFILQDDGAFIMEDRIFYRLPFGFLSYPFYGLAKKDFDRMFTYRHAVLKYDLENSQQTEPKRILISGASGTIGSSLCAFFKTRGHEVIRLVRKKGELAADERFWDPYEGVLDLDQIGKIDAVINLNGVDISRGRWTKSQKKKIIDSRIIPTFFLAEKISQMPVRPAVFISSSAIGYYGDGQDTPLTETMPCGQCFISTVCDLWEDAAQPSEKAGIRTIKLRIGIVLTPAGGALKRMAPAFKAGAGVQLSDGKQYMSWVSMDDAVRVFDHIIQTPDIEGPVNLTAPEPVTNRKFSQTLGKVLSRKILFRMPAWVAKLLWSQMGKETLLTSARVMPEKLLKTGFEFQHDTVEKAFRHLLGRQ